MFCNQGFADYVLGKTVITPCVRIVVAWIELVTGRRRGDKIGRYSEEFKVQVVRQMMPPNPVSVGELSRETGVTAATLNVEMPWYTSAGVFIPKDW